MAPSTPKYPIKDTENHLENFERREVIRDSNSAWRNPIRSLRKPDGGIRLVSNLIALNDIVEKDVYRLSNIRDVVRATQDAEFITVFDLKEGVYSIEIEEEDKLRACSTLCICKKYTANIKHFFLDMQKNYPYASFHKQNAEHIFNLFIFHMQKSEHTFLKKILCKIFP